MWQMLLFSSLDCVVTNSAWVVTNSDWVITNSGWVVTNLDLGFRDIDVFSFSTGDYKNLIWGSVLDESFQPKG